jgi:hypothetical protein
MRPATLASLPSLAPADARPGPRAPQPGFLRRTFAAIAEVLAEARDLHRTLSRRYPFADF